MPPVEQPKCQVTRAGEGIGTSSQHHGHPILTSRACCGQDREIARLPSNFSNINVAARSPRRTQDFHRCGDITTLGQWGMRLSLSQFEGRVFSNDEFARRALGCFVQLLSQKVATHPEGRSFRAMSTRVDTSFGEPVSDNIWLALS